MIFLFWPCPHSIQDPSSPTRYWTHAPHSGSRVLTTGIPAKSPKIMISDSLIYTQLNWKRSVFIPIPRKVNVKESSNYCTIALISYESKVMFKILQARLQQYTNQELPDIQAGFRKSRQTRDQITNTPGSQKKQENSRKTSTSASLTAPKPLTVWITTNYGKFFKKWEYRTTLPTSWETCMQFRKQQLEPDMEQWAGSKLGKENVKAVYCHPAYLT